MKKSFPFNMFSISKCNHVVVLFAVGLLIILTANNTKAQVANQVLWVRADKGVNSATGVPAATNTQITTWYDQATSDGIQNGVAPTVDPGQPEPNLPALPYYKYSSSATDNFNHNPVINFSYLNYGNAVQFTTPALGSQTVFAVFRAAGIGYYYDTMLLYGGDISDPSAGDPAPLRADMSFSVWNTSRLNVWGGSSGDFYALGTLKLETQISIGTLKRNRVNDENVTHSIYGNGSTDILDLNADPDNSRTGEGRYLSGMVRIGKHFSGPTDLNNPLARLDGQFAELMVYNSVLSDADRAKVESYLAVKYGITLTGGTRLLGSTVGNSSYPYVNSSGTTIRASDATYKYDVFGLGRDDYFGLDQRISKSNNTNDILTASTNSDLTSLNLNKTRTAIDGDKEFMLFANNKGSSDVVNTQTTELPTNVTLRLDREWKVNYSNTDGSNIQNVSLKFDLSGFTFTGATIDNLMLLIDTDGDGDFTTGTISKIPASTFVSGSNVTFNNINLTDGYVFTLGIFTYTGTVTGTVFNDPNGGNVNNSSGTTNAIPSGIYANLINNTTGLVAASVSVATAGTYTFSSVTAGTYYVSLTKAQATVGAAAPSPSLPSSWINTGEYIGAENTGNDGTINGKSTTFTILLADQNNVNFGIEYVTATDDINQTPQGKAVSGNLLTNDNNLTTVTSITIGGTTYPVTTSTPATQIITGVGTIVVNSDGTYTFTPATGYTGSVPPINYTATNVNGGTDNANLYVTVVKDVVTGANNPPVANHDVATIKQGETVTVKPLTNDSDPDKDALTVTNISYNGTTISTNSASPTTITVGGVIAGTAYWNTTTNELVFISNSTYVGDVPFIYTISDEKLGTATSSINITVTSTATPSIVANDDANAAPQGSTMTGNVKSNDTWGGTNPAITAANVTINGTTTNLTPGTATAIAGVGTITLNAGGTYTFVPESTFTGTVPVTYTVTNTEGATGKATLYLTSIPKKAARSCLISNKNVTNILK